MRKCVFLGDWVGEKAVGVQRYALQILLELDRRMRDGSLKMDAEMLVPENLQWDAPFERICVKRIGSERNKLEKYVWQHWTFPHYVRKTRGIGVDLTNALPVWGCDICAIHDCIADAFPENFVDHRLFCRLQLIKERRAMRIAGRKIVTLTNDSRKEIEKYYRDLDHRLSIVTCGWEHMNEIEVNESIFAKYPQIVPDKYFFSLGSRYKHKNFQWIVKCAKKNSAYLFVITGTDAFSSVDKDVQENKPQNVIFTGYITDGEIKALMQHCRALIQPSFYEGFGLPPLEALSQGADIVVSNASCLPEIYGTSAYYIDPHSDGCDLDELMDGSVHGADEVLRKYSWKRAATVASSPPSGVNCFSIPQYKSAIFVSGRCPIS